MGMTIDEAISWIITISEHEGEDIPIYDTDVEAIKTAVSTMRKYQKIEDIVRNYYNEQYTDKLDIEIIEMISEVLCDGNED